jgi:hypothetical protein
MKRKRVLKGLCAVILALSQAVTALGATANVIVDGKTVDFGSDESVIVDGTTYVPIRAVFENFGDGTTVDWDSTEKAVLINYSGESLKLYTKTGEVSYKGNSTTLSNKPLLQNGRTLLPVRELCEMLGGTVDWNGETKTVVVNSQKDETAKASEEVVIPSGIKDEVAEEIRSVAGKPLPQAVYAIFQSEEKYDINDVEILCRVADCEGYEALEQALKDILNANEYDDSDKYFNNFAKEYLNAILKLEDKSFIKNKIMKSVFIDSNIVADRTVSVRETAEKLSKPLDLSGEKIAVNANMEVLARICYALGSLCDEHLTTSDLLDSNFSVMFWYANAVLEENKGWASMLPDYPSLLTLQIRCSADVEELKGEILPKAIYEVFNNNKFNSQLNQVKNLKKALEIADSKGYENLKKAFEVYVKNLETSYYDDTDYNDDYNDDVDAIGLYFETLANLKDKSFMTGPTAEIYKNGLVKVDESVTVDDMISSIDKHSRDKSEKVVAPPELELLARMLTVIVENGDITKSENAGTLMYVLDYVIYEVGENELISDNNDAASYILNIYKTYYFGYLESYMH